jgi:NAD(P)-dependent dehydrogenase (short-subunit alcohol dehydrogenase family)
MAEGLKGPFDLTGRVAVVTGAASGIGAGIAEVLSDAGATVVIVDRDRAGAERQAASLTAAGGKAGVVEIDLGDEASIVRGCAEIVAAWGAPWVVVNNAGLQHRELLLEGTVEFWDRTNAVNARGPFLMTRELGRAMAAKGAGGRIVNIASAALIGSICKGHAAYAASKAALLGLSKASALELIGDRITVNTVLPGGVATPGAASVQGPRPEGPGCRPPPLGLSEARDIGAAVLFFAGPGAGRVTDQVIAVDAGWSLS